MGINFRKAVAPSNPNSKTTSAHLSLIIFCKTDLFYPNIKSHSFAKSPRVSSPVYFSDMTSCHDRR